MGTSHPAFDSNTRSGSWDEISDPAPGNLSAPAPIEDRSQETPLTDDTEVHVTFTISGYVPVGEIDAETVEGAIRVLRREFVSRGAESFVRGYVMDVAGTGLNITVED